MSTLHFSTLTGYSQYSVQFIDKTTLGSSAILGIRYDFPTRDPDALTTFIRQGAHLTTNEYASTLFFEENVLTVSGISLAGSIGSSFLCLWRLFLTENMQARDNILHRLPRVSGASKSRATTLPCRKVD